MKSKSLSGGRALAIDFFLILDLYPVHSAKCRLPSKSLWKWLCEFSVLWLSDLNIVCLCCPGGVRVLGVLWPPCSSRETHFLSGVPGELDPHWSKCMAFPMSPQYTSVYAIALLG